MPNKHRTHASSGTEQHETTSSDHQGQQPAEHDVLLNGNAFQAQKLGGAKADDQDKDGRSKSDRDGQGKSDRDGGKSPIEQLGALASRFVSPEVIDNIKERAEGIYERGMRMAKQRPYLALGIAVGGGVVLVGALSTRLGRVALLGAIGIGAEMIRREIRDGGFNGRANASA